MRLIRANFLTYSIDVADALWPDDESAIEEAMDEMFSMCGNVGQESLIGDYLDHFWEWALQALEEEDAYGTYFGDFADMVANEWYGGDYQKWYGTDMIWGAGWVMIAKQSGYHDSEDEYGEGTGQDIL